MMFSKLIAPAVSTSLNIFPHENCNYDSDTVKQVICPLFVAPLHSYLCLEWIKQCCQFVQRIQEWLALTVGENVKGNRNPIPNSGN